MARSEIAHLVEDDQVHAGEMLGEPVLPTVACLGLDPIDEVDDVVKASSDTIADTASGDSDGDS